MGQYGVGVGGGAAVVAKSRRCLKCWGTVRYMAPRNSTCATTWLRYSRSIRSIHRWLGKTTYVGTKEDEQSKDRYSRTLLMCSQARIEAPF